MARTKNKARKSTGQHVNGKRKREQDESPRPNKKQNTKDVSSPKPNEKQDTKEIPVLPGRPQQTQVDKTIAKETPSDLVKRFTEAIKQYEGDISTIELEDKSLPVKAFGDTSDFTEERLVNNLSQFLEKYVKGGIEELKTCSRASSPHTLIITSSAIRAQDVLREIRKYGSKDSKIAKLFAKHMKLNEMVTYVQKTKFGLGAGTSTRVKDLIDQDALKVGDLKRVVLDASYLDEKNRTIFSDREGFIRLLELMNLDTLKIRFGSGATEVLVF